MSQILADKLAFVTGAGGGIGRAICRLFAKEGAKVIAADQNAKSADETVGELAGSNHLPVHIDVASLQSVEEAFRMSIHRFSQAPTVVVNAAGITRDNFLLKLSSKDFENVVDVNLKGTFFVIKTGVNSMMEANVAAGGSIVNIGSIIGKNGNIGQSNYSASKAGVEALTKCAAMEFGKFGVRVNAVLPGIIDTAMIQTVPSNVMQMFTDRIALGRIGRPEEIAELVLFLASDKSSYISGASIEATGGLH